MGGPEVRAVIYGQIEAERLRQVSLGFSEAGDDANTPDAWIAKLAREVGLATPSPDESGPLWEKRYQRQLIRIAALAVAAAEAYRRDARVAGDFQKGGS